MAEFDADAEASSDLSLTLRLPGELAPQSSSGRLFNVLRRGNAMFFMQRRLQCKK
ncbi:hypothetical protein RUM43_013464 [Polyplax serrata]|uniref:Uncharacterized protein n=1 Tax=Polyplax serrata TaxID=468196 RepID=A0AAN8PI01_POLSC